MSSVDPQEQYGKLIVSRFYGPAADFRVGIAFLSVAYSLIVLLIISYLMSSNNSDQIIGRILLILLLCGFLLMFWKINKQYREAPKYHSLELKGKLDWDLYENGMLIKGFTDESSYQLVTAFLPFNNISEIYISREKDIITELIKKIHLKEKSDSIQSIAPTQIDLKAIEWVQKYVWVFYNGKPMAMKRIFFKDLYSFCKYIKTKNIRVI